MKNQFVKRFSNFKDTKSLLFDPIFVTSTLFDPKFALLLNQEQIKEAIKFINLLLSQTQNSINHVNSSEEIVNNENGKQNESTIYNMILNALE